MSGWERERNRGSGRQQVLAVFSGDRARGCSSTSMVNQRCGLSQRTNSLPLKSLLGGFLLLDRDVSIGLVRNHLPAAGQAGQDRGFGSALRQQHETMAFIGLGSAPVCRVHGYAFAQASMAGMSIFSGQTLSALRRAYDETWMLRASTNGAPSPMVAPKRRFLLVPWSVFVCS